MFIGQCLQNEWSSHIDSKHCDSWFVSGMPRGSFVRCLRTPFKYFLVNQSGAYPRYDLNPIGRGFPSFTMLRQLKGENHYSKGGDSLWNLPVFLKVALLRKVYRKKSVSSTLGVYIIILVASKLYLIFSSSLIWISCLIYWPSPGNTQLISYNQAT